MSKIVRESTAELTAKAMRDEILALNCAGDDVHGRALRGDNKMDAVARDSWAKRQI
jgi:hypothetical protein